MYITTTMTKIRQGKAH